MLRRYILFLKKHPLITATLAIVYAVLCIKTMNVDTYLQGFVLRSMLCGAMAFFLYQISGDKTLASSYNSTWYVVKVALGYWILALLLGLIGLATTSDSGAPLWDNIPYQMFTMFLMFIFVGLFEEMAFRAVINDAIIYKFRNKKYVFVLSALVSSLVFGAVHVIGAELNTNIAIGQAIGKTIQTGVFGLTLLFLYWKTRNIWACGVVHGIYDFLLSIGYGIYNVPDDSRTSYVIAGEAGKGLIIAYAFFTVIELVIFLLVYLKIGKKIDYQKIREDW